MSDWCVIMKVKVYGGYGVYGLGLFSFRKCLVSLELDISSYVINEVILMRLAKIVRRRTDIAHLLKKAFSVILSALQYLLKSAECTVTHFVSQFSSSASLWPYTLFSTPFPNILSAHRNSR